MEIIKSKNQENIKQRKKRKFLKTYFWNISIKLRNSYQD